MARTSGRAGSGSFQESLTRSEVPDPVSAVRYRVEPGQDSFRLEYSSGEGIPDGAVGLKWFIGSGRIGRSYLFERQGYLYQAPVSYYSLAGEWRASPGFGKGPLHFTRAVEPACLQCHASQPRHVAGTDNRFEDPPFLQPGIACERCHGAGARHVERVGKAKAKAPGGLEIVHPGKLEPDRRDSVCAQCHLTGAARVARRAKSDAPYQPGDRLSDSLAVYVWSDAGSSRVTVTSHFEKLSHSQCQKGSGERMWCVTCHDPHGEPEPAQKTAFYRDRCQSCHAQKPCAAPAALREAKGNDCAGCHMPKAQASDSEHMVYTDHSIPRGPTAGPASAPAGERALVEFWPGKGSARDLALAYAIVAMTEPQVRKQAMGLLQTAAAGNPDDAAVLLQLAQFFERTGQAPAAKALYDRVLGMGAATSAAMITRGSLAAQDGAIDQAIELWNRALARNPALTGARLNLAVAQFRKGDREAAQASARKALQFDPGNAQARDLLRELSR